MVETGEIPLGKKILFNTLWGLGFVTLLVAMMLGLYHLLP